MVAFHRYTQQRLDDLCEFGAYVASRSPELTDDDMDDLLMFVGSDEGLEWRIFYRQVSCMHIAVAPRPWCTTWEMLLSLMHLQSWEYDVGNLRDVFDIPLPSLWWLETHTTDYNRQIEIEL